MGHQRATTLSVSTHHPHLLLSSSPWSSSSLLLLFCCVASTGSEFSPSCRTRHESCAHASLIRDLRHIHTSSLDQHWFHISLVLPDYDRHLLWQNMSHLCLQKSPQSPGPWAHTSSIGWYSNSEQQGGGGRGGGFNLAGANRRLDPAYKRSRNLHSGFRNRHRSKLPRLPTVRIGRFEVCSGSNVALRLDCEFPGGIFPGLAKPTQKSRKSNNELAGCREVDSIIVRVRFYCAPPAWNRYNYRASWLFPS